MNWYRGKVLPLTDDSPIMLMACIIATEDCKITNLDQESEKKNVWVRRCSLQFFFWQVLTIMNVGRFNEFRI